MAEVTSLPVSQAIVAEIHPANVAPKRSIALLMPPGPNFLARPSIVFFITLSVMAGSQLTGCK